MLNLKASSYGWAVSNLVAESDTDLFPKPFEFDVLKSFSEDIIKVLQSTDIETYSWSPGRRAVVPKGELSFRAAIQLDPWDSIILTALMKEFGELIERKRLSYREKIAFSYRFEPMQNGEMYQRDVDWPSFWDHPQLSCRFQPRFVNTNEKYCCP